MASKQAIESGRAFVRLFLKNDMSRQLVRSLKAAQGKLRQFGQSAIVTGRRVAFVGAAMAAPFVFATRTFAEFDDQMLSVATKSSAAADEMERLRDQAKLLGRTTSFTAIQVAESMVNLAKAGFGVREIAKSVPSVLNLARATGIDLAEAADIAAITLRQFKLDASEMPRVVDVMTATVNNSTQGMNDLAESLKFGALIATDYGLSLEEVSKTLGILANAGLRGTMGGTALRKIMLELADPSVQKKLEGMIGPITELGELKAPAEILQRLGEHMENVAMTGPQKLSLLRDLFQIRAVGAGAKLTSEDMTSLSDAIDNAAGSAAKSAKTMDSGLGGSFRILKSAIEGVKIEIGEALAPVLQKLSKLMTTNLQFAIKWIKANKGMVVAIAAATIGVIGLGVALVAMGVSLHIAAIGIGALATIVAVVLLPLKLVTVSLAFVVGGLGVAMSAFSFTAKVISGAFTVALVGLKITMLAVGTAFQLMAFAVNATIAVMSTLISLITLGPVGILAAIVAVVIGFDLFGVVAKTTLSAVDSGFTAARGAIVGTRDAIVGMGGAFLSAGTSVRSFGQSIRQAFAGAFTVVKAGFQRLVTDVGASWATLQTLLSTGDFTEAWKLGISIAKLEWVRFKQWMLKLWDSIAPAVNTAIVTIADSIGGILTNLKIGWGDIWDTLQNGLRTFLTALDTALSSIRSQIHVMQAFFGEKSDFESTSPLQLLVPSGRSAEKKATEDEAARAQGDSIAEAIKGALVTAEQTPVEMAAAIVAREKELADAIKEHKDALIVAAKAAEELATGEDGARSRPTRPTGPAGGPGPLSAAATSVVPRGVALTATYSAAAARISGFQPGGPEQKMAAGIERLDKKAERIVVVVEQFLAGQTVQ